MLNLRKLVAKPAKKTALIIGFICLLGISLTVAEVLDYFGPPPPGDPSAFTGPAIGLEYADTLLATLAPANEGAFEGGPTGTEHDTQLNVSIPQSQLLSTNVPTGGKPSPMWGTLPFVQQMMLFEEFAPQRLDPNGPVPALPFPQPTVGPAPHQDPASWAASGPDPVALEEFLAQPGIAPFPTEFANDIDENPWKAKIEAYLGRSLDTPPAEGRPPGRGWAHQRWNEFYPRVFFKTAQAAARLNYGFRDAVQRHGYSLGEFGPDGLYHQTYNNEQGTAYHIEGTTNGCGIKFHPNMPWQDNKALWTFDGTLPPKLLQVRYGEPVLMREYNALPIDASANHGFGLHTISTHEHNGHNPAESDGYTNAFFFPGQYYDYRWPMALAGYDTINTDASDPRAAFPCSPGEQIYVNDANPGLKTCENGTIKIRGDWRETMSTHWFHDHMLDYTAQNVYKGNAVMMNYYSALDRGKEDFNDGVNLRLPSGTALDWGNRDYDVNLVIADKAWDRQGQLWFNIFNKDGFIGDRVLTNWLYKPYLDVRARRYRFRILNGAVSRYFAIALVQQVSGSGGELPGPPGSGISYNRVPLHMIANDGNIMEHAVPFDGSMDLDRDGSLLDHKGQLPTQAIAERYDIIVDFSKYGIQPGDKLYFVNVQEHTNGKVTGDKIPLADILSENYLPETRDKDDDGIADEWINGDPGVGKFLEFRVHAYAGTDQSMDPANYVPGQLKMIPLKLDRDNPEDQAKLAAARHRTFTFGRSDGTDQKPWTIKTDGGTGFGMDPRRVSAAPQLAHGPTQAGFSGDGTLEVWSIENGGQGWSHPVHVHFEEGIILRRGGVAPPEWEKWARKDLYRIGPDPDDTESVEIAINFREFAGTYVEHCHNTQHEDNAMLLRWDLEHPGQFTLMPTPMPTWDGVEYVDSAALPTFRTGDGEGPSGTVGDVTLFESLGQNPGEFSFTAAALSGIGPYQYRFFMRPASGVWAQQQAYSTNNIWTWNTTGFAPGTYYIMAYARSAGSTAALEAAGVLTHVIVGQAATSATLAKSAGANPGEVDFTAGAGGGQAPYQYEFYMRPSTGSWEKKQSYSTNNKWTWDTTGAAPGTYYIQVYARSQGSNAKYEAAKAMTFNLGPPAATAVTLGKAAGNPGEFIFTAAASGGQAPYEYRFFMRPATGTWTQQQAYSTTDNWTWNTTGVPAGTYYIQVYARAQGSSATYEAGKAVTHVVP